MAKSKIPAGVTPDHFMDIRKMLLRVLKETGAKRVNMRLNESGKEEPSPVFIGCVEDDDMARKRVAMNEPDTGLFRFGDKEHAVVYNECVSAGRRGRMTERDWKSQLAEKSPNAKFLGPRLGAMHQKFVGITVDNGRGYRCVGTLTAGFSRKPVRTSEQGYHLCLLVSAIGRPANGGVSGEVATDTLGFSRPGVFSFFYTSYQS